jgi:hypothetical protein
VPIALQGSRTVGLVVPESAILPEARAYRRYLNGHGIGCLTANSPTDRALEGTDAVISLAGFMPCWTFVDKPLVCDFASRSTRSPKHLRDWIKRRVGKIPDLGVYQSEYVRAASPKARCSIYRDMGFFADLIQPREADPTWDVVYTGETRRPGLVEALLRLADWGMSVAVAGPRFRVPHKVEYLGMMSLAETYAVLSKGRFGLNFVPARYPYEQQQSTKLIEYAAAGLDVLTSRTPWIESFLRSRGGRVTWLEDVRDVRDLNRTLEPPNVSDLDWEQVMSRTRIVDWLLSST